MQIIDLGSIGNVDHYAIFCSNLQRASKHNKAATFLHWNIRKDVTSVQKKNWYEYEIQIETISCDMPMHTDQIRPDHCYADLNIAGNTINGIKTNKLNTDTVHFLSVHHFE